MKLLSKMSMETRRRLRRALAIMLSVVLVAGLGLSYSPDRVLKAEELTAAEIETEAQESAKEAEPVKEEEPAKEEPKKEEPKKEEPPAKEEAPAKSEEPKKEEAPAKTEAPAKEEAPAQESVDVQEDKSGSGGGNEAAGNEGSAEEPSNAVNEQEIVLEAGGDAQAAEEPEAAAEADEAEETWTVTFYNRDAEVHKTVKVKKGEAIGGDMPAAIAREDYSAYWALGDIVQGGQGKEIRVTGKRINGNFKPDSDTVVVPDYDMITRTVTFYDSEGGSVIADGTKTVGPETNYCLNDIPAVPMKDGYRGKWVYAGGDFSNNVTVTDNMAVWASYDQTVFTVTFTVDGETYQTDTYSGGDKLTLPADPASEGKEFTGWFLGETKLNGGEEVNSDMTVTAGFGDKFRVIFVVENGEGEPETISQYFMSAGETIGTMPEDPFSSGKVFEKWVNEETGETVTADTVVNGSITARAQFRGVGVYNIKAEYYYVGDSGKDVVFSTDLRQVEEHELPYTITAPATISTDADEVAGSPVYYPETPSVTVQKEDFSGGSATVRIKFVKYTATYDVVYMLKDLTGDGYSEIERESGVQGVLNSYVTPKVKAYDYCTLEQAETAQLTQESGQELRVLYTRKNMQLSFETNGGSYVSAVNAPYGSSVALPAENPVREGYKFNGWYSDTALKNKVTGAVTLNGNTTLYAGWKGDKVNYTVVYMFEKYNDTGTSASYVYDNSRTASAEAGTTVTASSAPNITRNGWEKDTSKNANSSVVVEADGSSVLLVYYKLKEYTFTFNAGTYSSVWSSYDVTATLTGKGVSGKGNLSYTMKVKLGQDISAAWPGNVTGEYSTGGWRPQRVSVGFNGWVPAGGNTRYVTKRTSVTEDMLPSNGSSLTFTASWSDNTSEYTVNYWLQNADDDGYTKSDVYSQTYTSSSGNLSAKDINGYTYDHGNSGAQGVKQYDFYYNRDTYRIDYYYGSEQLNSISNVKFDAKINRKQYNWTPTAEQCGVDDDFTFGGWYDNATCQGEPYDFAKMPASNLVLYAKWSAPSYTVSFVNAHDSSQAAESQTVDKYKKAVKPANPSRAGYSFDGWYAAAEGNDLFDWNTQIAADTTVYAHWVKMNLSYIVHYVDGEGNPVASDKEVTNPNLEAGQIITETAIAVAGYRPNEASQTLTLAEADNSITFVYSEKAESTGYTVRYVIGSGEEGAGAAVAAEKTVDDVPGDTSSVVEMAAAIDYSALYAAHPELKGIEFHPDEVEKTLVLTADAAQNVLTFTYSSFRHANVTLHFVDMAGNKIANDDVQKLKVGKTFTLNRTAIAGWELNKAATGTAYDGAAAGAEYKITEDAAASGLEFTLFYQKKATITALSASKQYDGTALKLPEEQVRIEGLLEGHSLGSVSFAYDGADTEDGRLAAGVATVTPQNAVIEGAPSADYYAIRYISGTLEVTKINVTIRVEPDRWTGAVYNGEVYKAGFTNPGKGIEDYVIISHEGYKKAHLDAVWSAISAKAQHDETAAGLGFYGAAQKDAGDYTYNIDVTMADLPQDSNYSVGLYVRPGRLQILPKDASVSTESAAKTYDGTALTQPAGSISGLVAADEGKVKVTGTGSQTEPGTSENGYSIDWGGVNSGNYNIVNEKAGTLTVTAGSVVLTAASGSKTYDGKALTNAGVTASGLPEGFTAEATASGSQTDAGTSANVVNDGWKIKDASGADVTDRFTLSQKVDGTLTVNKAPAVITTGSGSKAYDGKALTNAEAGITGLADGETAAVTATGSQTEVGSGSNTYSISWGTAKAANYAVTENLGTLTVTDRDAEVVLTAASSSKTYDGEPLANEEVTASGLPEGFMAEATASGSITDAGSAENVVNEGFIIRNAAGEDRTANFKNIQTVNGTLTVNPKDVTVTTGSGSKAYDGGALTNAEAAIEGLVNDETASVTATGSQTEVGSSDNTYTIEWGTAKAGNYKVTGNAGKLTVTENRAAVVLTAASGSKTYDGTALVDASVTASGLPEGFTVSATATGSQTDAGSSPNVVSDRFFIKNAEGADKTANFTNVSKADGVLTVNKAPVTVTTGGGSKEYDGKALTNDEAKIEGLVNGETAAVTATGSQTEPGTSDNGYSIEWGTATASNYTLSENLGTLIVTENNAEVTLTAGSGSKTYDGEALTNSEVKADGLPEGFTLEASASAGITDAGTVSNPVDDGFIIRNAAGADMTAAFANVKKVAGTLTVEPKPVTVTTGSGSKPYDGTALRVPEAVIEGLVNGETAEVSATGSVTEVGSADNTYTISWGETNGENYELSEKIGTLTITENKAEVTLTAPSDSKIYDGAELKADGTGDKKVVAGGLPEGFTVEATASGSITDAGETANVVDDGFIIRNAAGEDKTANFTNVKKVDGTLTISPKALTVVTGSASKPYDGTELTNEDASIEGLVDGETLGIENTGSITETGSAENTCTLTWAADGNDYTAKESNYEVTENLGTLTVTDSSVDVTLTAASASKTYDGSALTASEVTAAGLPEGFTVEATASGSQTDAGTGKNVVDDGYIIRNAAGEDRTANFKKVEKIDGTLTVNPKPVTITTGSGSKAYDGTALTNTEAVIDGIVDGETYGLSATGTITEVGSEQNGYEMTWAGKGNDFSARANNYTVSESLGTLTVTTNGAAITLTASSGRKEYDGKALKNEEVSASGLPEGFTVEAKARGSQINVGSSANTVRSGYVIKNADGDNKTANFTNVSTVEGTLTVDPRTVKITTGSGSKEYDGDALRIAEADIEGLAPGEVATVTATGSQTEVGSSDNTYSIRWIHSANADNYVIEEELGKLNVTANTSEVTLTAASGTKTYDGKELADAGVTADGLPDGFTVSASASGSQTDVGSSANVVNDGYIIKNSDGADRTASFTNVKKADGTLTVDKRRVSLTSATDEKTYDGTALINNEITVGGDGFAEGEGSVFNVTGSQKDAGSSKNTFTYSLDAGTDAANYTITTEEGTLTVNPAGDKVTVTITEHSGSDKYDGTAKTVSGYDVSIDNALYAADSFSFSGNATVSGTDAGSYDMELKPEDFTNNNDNFTDVEFVINDGTLEIGKRDVILTSASASAVYSGIGLFNHLISVGGDGFAAGEGASYEVTGLQKIVGASLNLFKYLLNEGTNADNYNITTAFGTLTINNRPDDAKYEATVTAASDSVLYDGAEHSVSGFAGGSEDGIKVTAGGQSYTISGLSAEASATDAGTYTVPVTGTPKVTDEDGNNVTDQFIIHYVSGSLSIGKRSVRMTSGSSSREYNGKPLTNGDVTVTGDGFAKGEGASYDVTGSRTLAGSCANTFTYTLNDGTKAGNYDISTAEGTLTVTNRDAKYEITVQANDAGYKYDGTDKSVSGFRTLEFSLDGNKYTVDGLTAGVTAKDAGEYVSTVTGTAVVKDEAGNDVTAEFAVNTLPGKLVITRRSVTMTSGSATKEYDGNALTNAEVAVSGDGFAEGEGASYDVTGSRTLTGSNDNTFTYALNEGTKAENYVISTVPGTLTVTNRDAKYAVTVQANSAEYMYDGEDKTAEGLETTEFELDGNTYTVEGLTASVTAKDAGEYVSTVTGTPAVKDAKGNDVSAQFAVSTLPGKLVITRRSVTLTSGSAERRYNGRPLTNDKVTVSGDGFAEGEGATYDVTGKRTLTGMSENTFSYTLNSGTKECNYNITTVLGQLTVTNRDAKYTIELRPNSLTEKYDGSDKSVTGFEALRFNVDGNFYTVSGVEASATARNAGTYTVNATGTAAVFDSEGNNVSDQFKVTSVPGTLVIEPRTLTMTSATASKIYDGTDLTNAEVTVSGEGFAEGEGAAYSVTGLQKIAGASKNSFTYSLNEGTLAANYIITTDFGILTVTNRPDDAKYEVTVTAASDSVLYDGKEHSVSGFVGESEGGVAVTAGGQSYTVSGLSASASATGAGTYTSAVTGTPKVTDADGNDVTGQFIVKFVNGSLDIGRRNVTLTSESDSKRYDGRPLTNDKVTVSGDGFARGEGASYDVKGIRTLAGSSENTFTYTLNDGTDANNYNIKTVFGQLTVTNRDAKYEITVQANSAEYLYDGTEKTVSGFETLEFAVDGNNYTVSGLGASAAAVDAGEYVSSVTGSPVVKDAAGNDVTDQFAVMTRPGSLVIKQRSVTLTSGSATKEYDGNALTNPEVAVSGDGFAEGEGASYNVSGIRILTGSSENTFTYTLNAGTKAENYVIATVPGTLTVTNRDAKYAVTVQAKSAEYKYDGGDKTAEGLVTTEFELDGNTYTVEGLTAAVTAKDAGEYVSAVTGTPVVKDARGNDVSAQFAVSTQPGRLVITKRSVTLTSGSASREYNGRPLTNDEVAVTGDGFAEGEGATYNVTGSRTLTGVSENPFSYTLNSGTKEGNYDIKTVPGQLTVTSRDAQYSITLKVNSLTEKYDGTDKTASGFETLSFNIDGNSYTVSGIEAGVTERNAGTYPVNATGIATVLDADGNAVSDQFSVTVVPGSLTIEPRIITMTSGSASKTYDGTDLTNADVVVTGDGFAEGEGAGYNVTGLQKIAGACENIFTYVLNEGTRAANYIITTAFGTLTINNRPDEAKYEVTVTAASDSVLYDGEEHSVSGFIGESEGGVAVTAGGQSYTVSGLSASASATDAGTYTSAVTGSPRVTDADGNDVTGQFIVRFVNGSLSIGKRNVTLTSGSASKTYDGRPLRNDEVTVSGDGFAEGEGASYSVAGSQTIAGSGENSFTYVLNDGTNAENYVIRTVPGTLTVTNRDAKYEITVQASSAEYLYDGTEKTVSGFEALEFSVDGNNYTVEGLTASVTAKDAGEYVSSVTGTAAVKDAAGNDVTSQFAVKTQPGTLIIRPRSVTLTSGSATREYDGNELTNPEVAVSGDGFAEGEGAAYNVSGSRILAGSSDNTFSYTLNAGTKAENYVITTVPGTLTVTNRDAKYQITVQAVSAEYKYDGEDKTAEGLVSSEFTIDGNSYTVEGMTASVTAKDAGEYVSTVTGTAVVKDAKGNDVSAQFAVSTQPGKLVITKRSVTMTSGSADREYNGRPLTNDKVSVSGDGFAEGEGASYNVTGSRTLTGMSENTFSYTLNNGTKAGNYDIKTAFGQLTVTNRNAEYKITLRANSLTEKYDGTDKSAAGFETLRFMVDDNIYTVSGIEAGVTARNAGTYPVNATGIATVLDADGNAVSDQFSVTIVPGSLTIEPRVLTMTSATAGKVYDGTELTNAEVTVSGDGFAEGEGASYAVTGSQKLAGASENTFTYSLNEGTLAGNYSIATNFGTLTVTNRPDDAKYEVTVTAVSGSALYDGEEHSVSGFIGESEGGIAVTAGGQSYTVSGLSASASATDAGTYTSAITGSPKVSDEDGNDVTGQFIVRLVNGSLSIGKRSVIMTSGSASKTYDGRPLRNDEVTVSGDGFAEGEGASYDVKGIRTLAGMSENKFSYNLNDGTKSGNYDIKTVFGQLTVTNRDARYGIVLRPKSLTEKYDGTAKAVSGFESLSFTVDGSNYTVENVTAGYSAKDAGTYPVNVRGEAKVLDAEGNDVTEEFEVTSETGTLTIEPRTVNMKSGDAVKAYDGTELSNETVTVTGDGFAEGEGATYNVTGRRLLPGSEKNSFTYTLNEGTNAANYVISTTPGTLTVTNRDAKYEIMLQASSAEYMYDGTDKTAEGIETLGFSIGGNAYTVEGMTASVTAKDAGEYASIVTGTPVVKDKAGNDVSAQFAISTQPGRLVITPRKVMMTSGSATHTYNGRALRNDEVTVSGDGFAEGEGATYSVTGSRTIVGVSDNLFTYELNDGTKAGNYEISCIYGKLNVTNRDARYVLTLTPNGGTALYDGEEHSVSGFGSTTAVIDGESFEVSGLTAGVSGVDAGTYNVTVTGTPVVTDAAGNDVTEQFSVVSNEAALTILPRKVLLRSADESREYDGTPLTGSGEVSVEGDGFVGNDGVTVTPTASRTLVGAVRNTFDWAFSEGTKAGNYVVETEYGLLSITNRDALYEINMIANSDTVEYDGEEHSVSGFEQNEFDVEGGSYTVSGVDSEAKGTETGVYDTEISGAAEVRDEAGNDVSDQFAVSYRSGSLTITGVPEPGNGEGGAVIVDDGTDNTGGNGGAGNADGNGGNGLISNGGNGLTIETIPETVPATTAPAGYWALLNLVMMVITVIEALYMMFRRLRNKDEDEYEESNAEAAAGSEDDEQPKRRKQGMLSMIAAVVLAIISAVIFFITEDISNSMALFDKYTILMAILLIAAFAFIVNGTKTVESDDDGDSGDGSH